MKQRVEQIYDATLWLGDCRELLPTLGRVDAVVTDPPYGIGYSRHIQDWEHSTITGDHHVGVFAGVLKSEAAYVMTRWDVVHEWRQQFVDAGWKHKATVVWDRLAHTTGDLLAYVGTHDLILVMTKSRLLLRGPQQDVIRVRRIDNGAVGAAMGERLEHPTQKPVDLMLALIRPTTFDTIMDPFMGSGTTGVACAKLRRKFIGVEIEEKYHSIACRRIEAAYRQPDMFIAAPEPKPTQQPLFAGAQEGGA